MIVPPLRELHLLERHDVRLTRQELLHEIPEETLEVWEAIKAGRDRARRERAASQSA